MSDGILVILGALAGGLFGFLGQAMSTYVNRNKTKAEEKKAKEEAEKAKADAKSTNADTLGKLETRVDELVERNIRVERERDKERDAKREELKGIHNQLTTLQVVHAAFITKFEAMQILINEKDAKITEQDKKIKEQDYLITLQGKQIIEQEVLIISQGQQIVELQTLVDQHTKILKKTGQLTPRNG